MNTTTGAMSTEQMIAKTEGELAEARANLAAATDERLIEVYRDHVAGKLERLAWIHRILARDSEEAAAKVRNEQSQALQEKQAETAAQATQETPNGQA